MPPGFWRNFGLDVLFAFGVGVSLGVLAGLVPGIARLGGAEPFALALLAAVPFLANTFAVFAGTLGPGTPRRIAGLRGLGSAALLLVPFIPVSALPAVAGVYWLGVALSTPMQHRVWGVIYPPRTRGRLIGVIRTIQAAAAASTSLLGGLAADRFGGAAMVGVAGALSSVCVLGYLAIQAPLAAGSSGFHWRESLRLVTQHPVLRPLLLAQGLWGTGLIAATPLYPLVQIDRLQLSLAEIGWLAIVGSSATLLSYVAWGAIGDRWGGAPVMLGGAAVGLSTPLLYAVAGSLAPLWAAAAGAGLSSAAFEIGLATVLSQRVPLDQRAAHMAGWSAITGVRGMIVPLVVGGLVQAGLVSVTAALALCGLIALLGLALYVRAFQQILRLPPPPPRSSVAAGAVAAPTPGPALATTPAPAPAPAAAPVAAPVPSPEPVPLPAPVSTSTAAPAPGPGPRSAPASSQPDAAAGASAEPLSRAASPASAPPPPAPLPPAAPAD